MDSFQPLEHTSSSQIDFSMYNMYETIELVYLLCLFAGRRQYSESLKSIQTPCLCNLKLFELNTGHSGVQLDHHKRLS